MANTVIQLKKSATPSASPSSLAYGELAINYADGVLYYKSSNNAIASFYSRNPSYGTINAAGTLVISDQVDDILDIRAGDNITITGDAINDRITIAADLTSANNWANTKLANTSDVSFNGNLNFPTGNVTIGSNTFSKDMRVLDLVSDTSDYPTSGRGIFYITGANSTTSSNTSIVFRAFDTTSVPRHSAAIQVGKEGTWTGGGGVYPGFMSFWTRESGGTNNEVERMRITAAGDIGIGTTSPASKLDVTSSTNTSIILIHTALTGSTATDGFELSVGDNASWVWNYENTPIIFGANNAESMRITAAGNIGIGTPSPTSNLHVIGTANISSATLLVAGQNVLSSISTVGASANNWANTKLANTSGITFAGSLTFTGNVTTSQTMFAQHFDNTSDISLKQNITPIDDPMIVLSQLNPVSFNWKDGGRKSFGLIAQDVEKVLPEIINIREDGIKSLSYIDIISFLIAAVKQQQEDINTLNSRLDDLTK